VSAAEIRVSGHGGVFVAETCCVEGGLVHAEGRWRERMGANYAKVRLSDRRRYSWPQRRLTEIRWITSGEVAG